MSALSDALKAEKKPSQPKFETWIDSLEKVDRDALVAAATDSSLTNAAIVRACRSVGYAANKDTVAQWRRGHGFTR